MDIESRLGKLEDFAVETRERLTRIETRLEQTATKADVAELAASMIKWIVGVAFGMSAAGITVMTFVLNNATPKAAPPPPLVVAPAPAPQPIVIQLPAPK
jgi:hypothetical protein